MESERGLTTTDWDRVQFRDAEALGAVGVLDRLQEL